ncbi:MAG TPA: hypothetical protein PKI33_15280, partial [Anaerolineales bacterium]|nr:hypothetical protein [Anaerolineales bacterium]
MGKEKFLPIVFSSGLIFSLVFTVCIMTGWFIGSSIGQSNPEIFVATKFPWDTPAMLSAQAAGQGGLSGGLIGLILGLFLSFGSFGWFVAQLWKRKYPKMEVRDSQMLVFGWMFLPLRGGKLPESILDKFNPIVPKAIHEKIIKRSAKGFLIGCIVGGIPMCLGISTALGTPFVNLSYDWAVLMAIGFSLMGITGT